MRKIELWGRKHSNDDYDMIVDVKEIFKGVYSDTNVYAVKNVEVTEENIEKLNQLWNKLYDERDNVYDVNDIEDNIKNIFNQAEIELISNEGVIKYIQDLIVWDNYSKEFTNLTDWNEIKIYEYWNGHNWKTCINNDYYGDFYTSAKVEYNNSKWVDLDEWDGHNFYTKEKFEHEKIYKIIKIDEEEVKDKYLLYHTSQWQGNIDKGKIMDIEEIKEYLEELGRDIEVYMKKIKEL